MKLLGLIVLLAAVAICGSIASPARATPICLSTTPAAQQPLIVAERYLTRRATWIAQNLCCKNTSCAWTVPTTGASASAKVALSKKQANVWLVTVPGHICSVTQKPAGAGFAYKAKCARKSSS